MDFTQTRSVDEHGHVVVTLGRARSEFEISLERGIGGISVSRIELAGTRSLGLYFYPDEDQAVVDAIAQLIAERPKNEAARKAKWWAENGDKMVHFGSRVDLSINQAKAALTSIEARIVVGGERVEVLYRGKWLTLCRTDLADDVRTWISRPVKDSQEVVREYRDRIRYGARVDDQRFAVVDATSDG